jgi:hypothetical protein
MEIRSEAFVPFPRAAVFVAYRDRLGETVKHLPNIRAIRVLSREEAGGKTLLVNEWVGGGDIPAVARRVLSESMMKWNDHAAWDEAAHEVAWRTEVTAFSGALRSSGTNRFVEADGGTRLEVRGDLTLDAAKIPGIPRLLERSVGAALEKFFLSQVTLNNVAIAAALTKLLG